MVSLVQDLNQGPVANHDSKCCIVYHSARPDLQIRICHCQGHLEYDPGVPTILPSCPVTDSRTDCKKQPFIMETMFSWDARPQFGRCVTTVSKQDAPLKYLKVHNTLAQNTSILTCITNRNSNLTHFLLSVVLNFHCLQLWCSVRRA